MSYTPNLNLEKPQRGGSWWEKLNSDLDLIDTAIGTLNSAIDDLPQEYRYSDTFNSTTGVAVSLPVSVDSINEYDVHVTPTSRAGAIGDIWATKGTSSVTVYCSEVNTTDTFEITITYLGDVSSYGGSMYRRYYVSPSTGISDHSDSGESGSLAAMISAIGSTPAILELPGNKTYTLTAYDVTVPTTLFLLPQPGAIINIGSSRTLTINGGLVAGRWQIFSGSGTLAFGVRSIGEAYFEWTGAVGDGTTDCGTPVNMLADACRANVIPMSFGRGNFYTTTSFNFTGANFDIGLQAVGWVIRGAGPGATMITGNLSSGYPIVDMTDCYRSTLKDIRILGQVAGSQLCGVLYAMVGSVLATENQMENVLITGEYTEAGFINVSADLHKMHQCSVLGPCGAIYTSDRDALGGSVIQSAYQTITGAPNMTLCYIVDSEIEGTGGDSVNWDAAIVADEMGKLSILQTYLAQGTAAKCGIMVAGSSGVFYDAHQIDFISSRYENQGSLDGVFLWKETDDDLRNSIFIGEAGNGVVGTGDLIYLEGNGAFTSSVFKITAEATEWDHFVTRGGTGTITHCEIFEQTIAGSLQNGIDANILGDGNIVHLLNWNDNWLDVSGVCTFFAGSSGRIDVNPTNGYNTIASTGEKARKFTGHIKTDWLLTSNAGPSGSDVTHYTYTLTGDLFQANTAQNAGNFRITAWGTFTANSNTKTLKAKFGIQSSETTLVQNDQSTAPNGSNWRIEIDLARIGLTTDWEYCAKMIVGSTAQTIGVGYISGDPDVSTVDLILTVDAAASDVLFRAVALDLF